MFVGLFAAIMEFAIFIIACYVLYDIFLSDFVGEKLSINKKKKSEASSVSKIAQVKLVSDDPKDIEKFIAANAQFLSDEMVKKLVDRIEMIKYDQIINDDSLKKRIEDVAAMQAAEEPEIEVPAKKKDKR